MLNLFSIIDTIKSNGGGRCLMITKIPYTK